MKMNRKYSLCIGSSAFAAMCLLMTACLFVTACTADDVDEKAAVAANRPITVYASVSEPMQGNTRSEGREKDGWNVVAGSFALVYPTTDMSNAVGVCSFSDNGGRAYHATRGENDTLEGISAPLLPGELRITSSGSVRFYMDNVLALESEGTSAPGEIIFNDALKKRFSARVEDMEHRPGLAGDDNSTNDLVWGICDVKYPENENAYYPPLSFNNLYHRMSRISVLIIDEYDPKSEGMQQAYNVNPMKIWITGVRTECSSFNRETGVVTVDNAPATTLYLLGTSEDPGEKLTYDGTFSAEEQEKFDAAVPDNKDKPDDEKITVYCYTTPNIILPPQTFDDTPMLYIRYGGQTYAGRLPNTVTSTDAEDHTTNTSMQFEAGKHLLLRVRFKPSFNDELNVDVSLVDWFRFGGSTWSVSGRLAGIHTVDMWKSFVADYNELDGVVEGSPKEAEIKEKLRRYGDMTKKIPEFLLITHITAEDLEGEGMRIKRAVYENYPFLIDFSRNYMIKGYKYKYENEKGYWVREKLAESGDKYVSEDLTTSKDSKCLPTELLNDITVVE